MNSDLDYNAIPPIYRNPAAVKHPLPSSVSLIAYVCVTAYSSGHATSPTFVKTFFASPLLEMPMFFSHVFSFECTHVAFEIMLRNLTISKWF